MKPPPARVRALSPALLVAVLVLCAGLQARAATEPASWPPHSGPARSSAPAPASDARLYVLAFSGIAIAQVAEDVLGGVLGVRYAVDPALSGKMSFHIEQRLTQSELLAEFEAALGRSGGAMARKDGQFVLAPKGVGAVEPRAQPAVRQPAAADPAAAGLAAARPWLILTGFACAGALAAMLALMLILAPSRGSRVRLAIGRPQSAARRAVLDHLLRNNAIAPELLERAQRLADSSRRPVERVLHSLGAVSDSQLVSAYAAVTGCAPWRPQEQPPLADQAGAEILPSRGLVLIGRSKRRLVVATADPLDDDAIAEVSRETSRRIGIVVGSPADIATACRTPDASVIPYDPAHSRA